MIGRTIEQYLVQKKLGSGNMGGVYLALDTRLDRPVALKFVLSDFNDHPSMAKRFLAEAKVLASLSCPNIPILYSYLIWEEKGVMAMEYVDGQNLEEMVRQRGPIPADVCVPLIKQALKGLSAAHRIGVVHRDLKPSNLMLSRDGVLKVVDFGIAKKIEVESGLTGIDTTVGTPLYMAPEQIQGKPVTPRTDIYSMGVVLYHLLAGQVPFNAVSVYDLQTAHVLQVPDPPTIHYPHIPASVVSAVMKALQKKPEDRFASAEEFLQALPDLQQPAWSQVSTTIQVATPPAAAALNPRTKLDQAPTSLQPSHSQPRATLAHDPVRIGYSSIAPESPIEPNLFPRNKILIASLATLIVVAGSSIAWMMQREPKPSGSAPVVANPQQSSLTNGPTLPGLPPIDSLPQIPVPVNPPPPSGGTGKGHSGTTTPINPPSDKTKVVPPPPLKPQEPPPGQELSGQWLGTYSDSNAPRDKTVVQMQVEESPGGTVNGDLTFTKADNTSGKCSLSNSAYSADTKKLKLLLHCSGPAAPPAYFNTPTRLAVANPSERSLSGSIDYFPTVTVDLRRQ